MQLRIRDYIFITLLSVFPFLLLLLSLKFCFENKFILNNNIFWILIIFLSVIFIISFILCLFFCLDHILNNQKIKWKRIMHLILLIIFNIIYLPFYYTNYFVKEKLLGYTLLIVNTFILGFFIFSTNKYLLNYFDKINSEKIVAKQEFKYFSKDGLFTIDVSNNYSCDKTLGDYVIACDNKIDDSFLGIYTYSYRDYTIKQLKDVYSFHIKQTKDYIIDAGYAFEIIEKDGYMILKYNNDMCVIIESRDYDINYDKNNDYRLIIIKEVIFSDNMLNDFNNLVNSIRFVGI